MGPIRRSVPTRVGIAGGVLIRLRRNRKESHAKARRCSQPRVIMRRLVFLRRQTTGLASGAPEVFSLLRVSPKLFRAARRSYTFGIQSPQRVVPGQRVSCGDLAGLAAWKAAPQRGREKGEARRLRPGAS